MLAFTFRNIQKKHRYTVYTFHVFSFSCTFMLWFKGQGHVTNLRRQSSRCGKHIRYITAMDLMNIPTGLMVMFGYIWLHEHNISICQQFIISTIVDEQHPPSHATPVLWPFSLVHDCVSYQLCWHDSIASSSRWPWSTKAASTVEVSFRSKLPTTSQKRVVAPNAGRDGGSFFFVDADRKSVV